MEFNDRTLINNAFTLLPLIKMCEDANIATKRNLCLLIRNNYINFQNITANYLMRLGSHNTILVEKWDGRINCSVFEEFYYTPDEALNSIANAPFDLVECEDTLHIEVCSIHLRDKVILDKIVAIIQQILDRFSNFKILEFKFSKQSKRNSLYSKISKVDYFNYTHILSKLTSSHIQKVRGIEYLHLLLNENNDNNFVTNSFPNIVELELLYYIQTETNEKYDKAIERFVNMFKSKATLLIYFILKIEDHDEVPESNKEIKTFVRLMKKFQKQKIRFGYAVSRPIGTMSLKDLSTIQPERVSFHFDLQAVYIKHLISRICEIPDKGFSNITNLQFIITAPFSDIYNKLSDKYKYFNNLKILLISLKYMTREVHQPIIVDRERQGLFIKSLLKPIKSLQILKLERMPLNKLTNLNETLARYFPELKALYLTYYIKLPLPIDNDFFMPFRNLEAIFIQCPGKREWSFPKSLRMINLFCNRNPRLTTGSHWDQPQSCACFDSARPFNVFVDNGKRRGIQTRIFMEKLVDYELYLRCCEVFRMKNFE